MYKEHAQPGVLAGWLVATLVGFSVTVGGAALIWVDQLSLAPLLVLLGYPFALVATFPAFLLRALVQYDQGAVAFSIAGFAFSVFLFFFTHEFLEPLGSPAADRAPLFFVYCVAGCCAGYAWWKTEDRKRHKILK